MNLVSTQQTMKKEQNGKERKEEKDNTKRKMQRRQIKFQQINQKKHSHIGETSCCFIEFI